MRLHPCSYKVCSVLAFVVRHCSPDAVITWCESESRHELFFFHLNWGKTIWRYTRAWLVARAGAGHGIPFGPLGRADAARIDDCPLYGAAATLHHFLSECDQLTQVFGPAPAPWAEVLIPTASNLDQFWPEGLQHNKA